MGVTIKFPVAQEYGGMRLREYLRRKCGVSASLLTALKQTAHGIEINGVHARVVDHIKPGDDVAITLPDDESDIPPVPIPVAVLYEDEHAIVFDKPPRLTVHPVRGHQGDTLANAAAFYAARRGEQYAFRAVNRLDRDTSGALLAAKNAYAAALLPKSVSKVYVGVCEGIIKTKGTVDKPIRLKEGHTIERETGEGGVRAFTHYEPLLSGNGHTLLRFTLETGRTHQIRVHMSSIGNPLAGDDLYGGSRALIGRQALHCAEVSFVRPVSNEEITVKAPLPEEFERLVKGE